MYFNLERNVWWEKVNPEGCAFRYMFIFIIIFIFFFLQKEKLTHVPLLLYNKVLCKEKIPHKVGSIMTRKILSRILIKNKNFTTSTLIWMEIRYFISKHNIVIYVLFLGIY